MVAALLVAVPAPKPASAAPITFTPVWNGGDLTASATVPYSASDIRTFTTQVAGPELGLPTTASVTDVARALMTTFENRPQLPSSTSGVAQPQTFPATVTQTVTTTVADATTCAPCATVTVTMPKATVAVWKTALSGLVTFMAAWASYFAGVLITALFTARGLPTTPPPGQTLFQQFVASRPGAWTTTLAIGYTLANLVELPINDLWLGQKINTAIVAPALTFALLQFLNQKIAPSMTAWLATFGGKISTAVWPLGQQVAQAVEMQVLAPADQARALAQSLNDVQTAMGAIVAAELPQFVPGHFPAYLNDLPPLVAQQIRDALTTAFIEAVMEEGFPQLFAQAAPVGGTIQDLRYRVPNTSTGQIPCMDGGYGNSQPLVPGDIVAFNACNGNPNQNWIGWNTSNCTSPNWGDCQGVPFQVTDDGMCLSPRDETSTGSQKLILAWCDGSLAQQWVHTFGKGLKDAANGLCVDLPGGNPTVGLQLQDYTCNATDAQQWYGFGSTLPPPLGGEPCDIYASAGTPCVAAYSTVRALYSNYGGALYGVQRASDGLSTDIGLLDTGGSVDASKQDSFCQGTTCTIEVIFDQSPQHNDLTITGASAAGGAADQGSPANALPITINGHKAYGVAFPGRTGYRDDNAHGTAVGGQAEGMYMVTSGSYVNDGCCFDFGNMEVNNSDNGNGHMDAVNFGTKCFFPPCTGDGPWVAADMENGLFQGGNGSNTNNLGNGSNFVTAMLKNNGQTTYALKGGDAQSGPLSTWYAGPLPNRGGYTPMHLEGAIGLGTGGDGSNSGIGSFFEGVMTAGYPSDAADNAVQANILAQGYGGSSSPCCVPPPPPALPPPPPGSNVDVMPSAAGAAVVHSAGGTGLGAYGFSSVFTINSGTGHLQETFLPYMGDRWFTQDLSDKYGTPPSRTEPVAVVHCGFTSVFTVDAANGHLRETFLHAIGDPWHTQDLTANYGTPPVVGGSRPTALVHTAGADPGSSPGCGYTSVFTIDAGTFDLQETYLPNSGFPGDPWKTQDLSAKYGAAPARGGNILTSVVHCGFTSVYYTDSGGGLQEAFLHAIGWPWHHQSLSANYGTPQVAPGTSPTAVVHFAGDGAGTCGYTSVYTIDAGNQHLQETYLPDEGFPGDPWKTQDLSAKYGAAPAGANGSPVALVHMGFTSVYYRGPNNDLQETFLHAIGAAWHHQSLSANYGSPGMLGDPIVLLHPDANGNFDWTSVFTITAVPSFHLQETYLPNVGFPGDPWKTQDLSAKYGTPQVQ
jgi:hypothetical protein